jgi:hypothetical protein
MICVNNTAGTVRDGDDRRSSWEKKIVHRLIHSAKYGSPVSFVDSCDGDANKDTLTSLGGIYGSSGLLRVRAVFFLIGLSVSVQYVQRKQLVELLTVLRVLGDRLHSAQLHCYERRLGKGAKTSGFASRE